MKVAVIDVGFNSLKMVKYRIDDGSRLRSYGQLGVMARLGDEVGEKGVLGEEPMARTIDAIKMCREAAAMDEISHIVLVGTSPLREAGNADEFLRRVSEETSLKMRVLTGDEEALYGLLGAAKSVDAPTMVFFDLGGGSLQIAYAEGFRVRRIVSLPLGVLRLTSRFSSKDGRFSRKNRSRLAKQVSRMIPSRRDLRVSGDATLVGTGGTVRALARLDQVASGYRLNKIHGYALENESVQQLSRKFTRLTLDELGEIDAIGVDRAKTIVAGALVVRVLMRRLGFGRMVVSTHGLRDGIMEEFLHRSAHPRTGASRMRELEHLMRLQKPAPPSRIGIEVIEELTRAGVFDRRQMAILMEGIERVQTREYVESNPDALFGMVMSEDLAMSHEDQLLLAISLVRARRPRTANWLAMEHGPMIRRDDLKSVRKMGTCIRLLEILVRTTAQLRVTYSGGLQIRVIGDVSKFPSRLARISAESLSSAIKRPVKIVVSPEERSTRLEPLKVK